MKNYKQALNKLAELSRRARAVTLIDVSPFHYEGPSRSDCIAQAALYFPYLSLLLIPVPTAKHVLNLCVSCGQPPVA